MAISEAENNYNAPVPNVRYMNVKSDESASATELREITIKYEMNAIFAIAE